MKLSPKFLIGLAMFAVVLTGPVEAQDRGLSVIAKKIAGSENFDVGRQVAVIIGIDQYQNWTPLRSAVREAQDFKRALAENYYVDEFVELYDSQANAVAIRRLFTQTLPDKLGIHDSLLVFYAGHGYLDASKSGFWIPVDGSVDVLAQDRWLPNAQLRNYLTQLKAQRVLVVADSCFSGDLLNTQRGASPVTDSAYFRQAVQLTSRQVLSSGASQTVPDQSEFGQALISFLERNTEPVIDTLTIYERIRKGVSQTLPLYGTLPGNETGGSFVLFRRTGSASPPPPQPPPVADKLAAARAPAVPGWVFQLGAGRLDEADAQIREMQYSGVEERNDGDRPYLHFSGADSGLNGMVDSLPTGNPDLTFAVWVRFPTQTLGKDKYQGFLDYGSSRSVALNRASVGTMNGRVVYVGASNDVWFNYVLPFDRWVHLAVTKKGRNLALFVDGKPSEVGLLRFDALITGKEFRLGTSESRETFTGDLGEVLVYPRVLTQLEISRLAKP